MQIAWYSPTHDKIVVQEINLDVTENIITFDPLPFDSETLLRDVVAHGIDELMLRSSLEMFYGQGFHWLEQGLWVRLGEV